VARPHGVDAAGRSGLVARRTSDYAGKSGLRAVWLALTSPAERHILPAARAADWLTGVALPFGLMALCYLTFSSSCRCNMPC